MSKITKAAKGESCTLQIYPYCDGDTEKTVYAHLPCPDKGMGFKSPDWWGAYGCHTCHSIIDGHKKTELTKFEILQVMWWARYRTMLRQIEQGMINV